MPLEATNPFVVELHCVPAALSTSVIPVMVPDAYKLTPAVNVVAPTTEMDAVVEATLSPMLVPADATSELAEKYKVSPVTLAKWLMLNLDAAVAVSVLLTIEITGLASTNADWMQEPPVDTVEPEISRLNAVAPPMDIPSAAAIIVDVVVIVTEVVWVVASPGAITTPLPADEIVVVVARIVKRVVVDAT